MDTSSDDEAGDEELLILLTVLLCLSRMHYPVAEVRHRGGCLSSLIVKFFFEKGSITPISALIDIFFDKERFIT
jgi:hypothetical protein